MIDDAITELTPTVGVKAACAAVGQPRAVTTVDTGSRRLHHQLRPPTRHRSHGR
jgi:hypothetical protein